jgi:serine protease Do
MNKKKSRNAKQAQQTAAKAGLPQLLFALIAVPLALIAMPSYGNDQDDGNVARRAPGVAVEHRGNALGLRLRDLSPPERETHAVKSGVLVEHAIGAVANAGLRAGDVVIKLNEAPVNDADDFWRAAENAGWKFTLTLKREGAVLTVVVGNV